MPKILRNRVRCLECNEIIESHTRHDFVKCKCGNIAVDGGLAYLRRVGNIDRYEELSEEIPDATG
jgi:hypothetical protein